MSTSVLDSTFLLTFLLAVGLFFFIRASVKDRTQVVTLSAMQPEETLLPSLKQYFTDRAYQVVQVDAPSNRVLLRGTVRPSWFLAVFLALLAAIGSLCLILVLTMLFPRETPLWLSLFLLSPLAGWFYWQRAGREETVTVQIEPCDDDRTRSQITVTAHRDEVAALQRSLNLQLVA
jgi:Cofactor assembly of complex C subunit B